jgi:hypothetical protein
MTGRKLRKDERVEHNLFTGERRISRTDPITGKRRKKELW